MNDENKKEQKVDTFFQFIKKQIKNCFLKIKTSGIIKTWKNINKKGRQTIILVLLCIIAIIISIFGIEKYISDNIDNKENTKQIIEVNIINKTDSNVDVDNVKNKINVNIDEKDKEYRQVKIIADKNLYIRKQPKESSEIIGTLPNGYITEVSDEQNGWCKLYNNPGWIYMKYVKYIK